MPAHSAKSRPEKPRFASRSAMPRTCAPGSCPSCKNLLDEAHAGGSKAKLAREQNGLVCARYLCDRMDELVRIVHDAVVRHLYPADNPSSGERLAVVATGGYGRGTLAPGSDVDLLFLLPYKQTAWGESVVEAMLYVLWDLKLKVGHATRSVEECLREAHGGHDDPHLPARSALPVRRPGALRRPGGALRRRRSSRPRRPNSSTPSSRSATPASPRPAPRATSSSRTSRTARAACATSTRCSGSPNTSTGCASPRSSCRPACSRRRSSSCSRAARSFCGACAATCISSPAAPRSA